MLFTKVVFDKRVSTDVAQVNRETGVLYLNPDIWDRLTPDEREFVLLHEKGHLELQTDDEYKANHYAVSNYLPVRNLTNAELGKRIRVISEVTDTSRYVSNFADPASLASAASFTNPLGGIIAGVGQVFSSLPLLGIGARSRQKEADNMAENQLKVLHAEADLDNAKAANTQKLIIVGSVFFVSLMVLYFVLFKKQ